MNETILNFIKSLNIDVEKVNTLEGSEIKRAYDVNPILARFTLYKNRDKNQKISIADVVGYDYGYMDIGKNLINNLSSFFDRDGDTYHSRSVSMLDIPQNQVMKQLKDSMEIEPICLIEVDNGVYNIGSNGMHRFNVMKIHYLNELSKINPKDKYAIKELNEKYKFDAKVSEIDLVKSYSSFMLNYLDKNVYLENEYDDNYQFTGNARLIDYSNPEEDKILTNEQLIEVVNKKLNQFLKTASKIEQKQFNQIVKDASRYESFNEYCNQILKQNGKGEQEWS